MIQLLAPNAVKKTSGIGSCITLGAQSPPSVTLYALFPDRSHRPAETDHQTRSRVSQRPVDQTPVTNALFGMITSFRSKSVIVSHEYGSYLPSPRSYQWLPYRNTHRTFEQNDQTGDEVTENSCKPKPRPTDNAAASHWSLSTRRPAIRTPSSHQRQ